MTAKVTTGPAPALPDGGWTHRLSWIGARVVIGLFLLMLAAEVIIRFTAPHSLDAAGMDSRTYLDATRRWLGGGPFYLPTQLAGPYQIEYGVVLYPPVALLLFVPFAFLPAVLWSAIPAAIMAAVIWHHRPSAWACTIILACLALSPETQTLYWFGTPTIWMGAFLALSTIWGWPGVLVMLKPAIFPFALLGIRDRRWWVAAGVLTIVSLVFLPMWFDWFHVLLNARGPRANVLYAIGDVPPLAMPLVAWAGRRSGGTGS